MAKQSLNGIMMDSKYCTKNPEQWSNNMLLHSIIAQSTTNHKIYYQTRFCASVSFSSKEGMAQFIKTMCDIVLSSKALCLK